MSRPTTVVGDGSPATCTSRAFVDAVAKGGVITFDCGPAPLTITLEETAKVFNDRSEKVVIDGGGRVTLSGGGRVRILYQNTCDPSQILTSEHCDNQPYPELTVQNLTFIDGTAKTSGGSGGAIYAQGGRLKVINSRFYDNVCAEVGTEAGGGAIRAVQQHQGRPVQIVNSTFGDADRPNACSNGGALSATSASISIVNSTFRFNRALGRGASPAREGLPGGGSGGAVFTTGDAIDLAVCGSRFDSNTANEGGGAILFVSHNRAGHVRIASSTLESNLSGTFESHPGMFVQAAEEPRLTDSVVR